MVERVQMEQVKLQEFNLENKESMVDWFNSYVLIQSCIEKLLPVVTLYLSRTSNVSEHLHLRPEATIILQFYVASGM